MKHSLLGAGLTALILISACGQRSSDVAESPSPRVSLTPRPSNEEIQISPATVQIYQNPDGWFALALPKPYSFTEEKDGLTFRSADQGFGGEISYLTDQGKPLQVGELEAKLKDEISRRLDEVNWQAPAERQEDGSLRIDWTGINAQGDRLDAVSFIEQHGETIYLMSAYGINQPYVNYNNDARLIVGTYVVRRESQQPSQASDETTAKDAAQS